MICSVMINRIIKISVIWKILKLCVIDVFRFLQMIFFQQVFLSDLLPSHKKTRISRINKNDGKRVFSYLSTWDQYDGKLREQIA